MTRKEFNLRRERLKRGLRQIDVAAGTFTHPRTYQKHEAQETLSEKLKNVYKNFFTLFDKK